MASVPASSTNNTTNQHPYHPHHQDRNNNNSGGDGGGGTGATSASSCLVDPLPSFLSSLPLPNSLESSKYPSMVSVAGGAHNRSTEEATMASGNSDIFSAAAAVAAAASGTHSHQYHGQHMSHSGMHSQPQTSAHHPSYDTSSLAFTQSNPGTTAGLSSQDAAAAAAAAAAVLANNTGSTTSPLDLNAYSISAFSRPLSQSSSTAAVLLGNENTGSTTPGRESLSSYSFGGSSLSGALQPTTGILSPQQQHQQHQQHRSYSDYSAYYRSPSTALGVTSSSAPGTGSSTSSALAAGSGVGANGGQFSSSVGMGQTPYYQQTTYQQYMRSGSTHPYYYSQIPSRYVPYGACPPIRHFVSPARPFKCPTCEQSFSRNHDLKRHVKIHSGIKPHRCPKCGKSFGRSDALKRHSMVKRCRSSTTIAASSTTAAPVSQSTGMHGQSSQHTVMTSVPSSSRLASSATGSMFGQSAAPGMSNNTSSIVSSMLSSRTNAI
ncbi:hypothetical protein EC988_005675 [Linderina pennispora]|nr:hypothetical protein EC988_005675 [Linderina pennispora]